MKVSWKRLLGGIILVVVLIGVPIGIYIYLDDSEAPSRPESDTAPFDHPVDRSGLPGQPAHRFTVQCGAGWHQRPYSA